MDFEFYLIAFSQLLKYLYIFLHHTNVMNYTDFFFTVYFRIILDLQNSWKDSTKCFHMPSPVSFTVNTMDVY